ncbi:MAG: M14 family zinc carboxypeptidase, partial [Solirubrobacterales bacterium]
MGRRPRADRAPARAGRGDSGGGAVVLISFAAPALAILAIATGADWAPKGGDRATTIGHSVRDRPIEARRWGDAGSERRMLVVGSIHGDETQGQRIVARLTGRRAERLDGIELWTLKTANPDGVAANTRGNAHGVDLNRNFPWSRRAIGPSSGYYSGPGPASEPETRALRRFLRRIRPEITVWYHQPWGRTLIPCDRRGRRVALRYARLSGLAARDCFP